MSKFSLYKAHSFSTKTISDNSSINMSINNDIVENLDFNNNDDPKVDHSHTLLPVSQQISQFNFILNALPSISPKINQETMTYLNQYQSYEIKFQINKPKAENHIHSSTNCTFPAIYQSILRLCFWNKDLQSQ